VHVHHATGEAKFWLEPTIALAQNFGLSQRNVAAARRLIVEHGMRSEQRGEGTSRVEVTQISAHGIWLLVEGRELFMPFKQFPWFHAAAIAAVMNVEMEGPGHLYWPDLDIDLAVESIEHPQRFPLVSQVRPGSGLQSRTGARRRKVVAKKRARRK
jgi:hypothetical protein